MCHSFMLSDKLFPSHQLQEEIKRDNDDFHNWIWKSCANSAYGAFISIAMAHGWVEGMKQAGVMLILTMLIQVCVREGGRGERMCE